MKIKVYTTKICPKCSILKNKLKEKNIDFEECTDVEEMKRLGIKAVPMALINGELVDFLKATRWVNEKKDTD